MLINRKKKFKSMFVTISIVAVFMSIGGAISAAQATAYLDGSANNKNTATLKATKNGTGSVYGTNSGANTQTRATAHRKITLLPDSVVASTGWLNPGQAKTATFSQTNGHNYYGKIAGQTLSSRGGARITVH